MQLEFSKVGKPVVCTLKMFRLNKLCLGLIPIHFFCLVVPVRRSLHTIVLSSGLLFSWNFFLSAVVLGTIAGLRDEHEIVAPQRYTGLILNMVTDAIMVVASVVLFWRETHLLWLAWAVICGLIQSIVLIVCTHDDSVELSRQFLVIFTAGRVLAFLDAYFLWMAYVFTWFLTVYFWLCIFSSFQISRLPKNYDALLDEELKDAYEKKREKVANEVYQQMVNEKYLDEAKKIRLSKLKSSDISSKI